MRFFCKTVIMSLPSFYVQYFEGNPAAQQFTALVRKHKKADTVAQITKIPAPSLPVGCILFYVDSDRSYKTLAQKGRRQIRIYDRHRLKQWFSNSLKGNHIIAQGKRARERNPGFTPTHHLQNAEGVP